MSKLKTIVLIAAIVLLVLIVQTEAMALTCNVPSTSYSTIQSAVDDGTCGTINVTAGTYNENIVISRALTLKGAGSASTFINGVGPGSSIAVLYITAAGNVALRAFTITNPPVTEDGDLRFGILTNSPISGVTYTISNNRVIGTNNPDAFEDYGIYGQNGGKENLLITNNVVTQTGSNNIVVETHQGKTEISYNTLDAGCYGADPIFVMTHSGKDVSNSQKVYHNSIDMGTGAGVGIDPATGISFAAVASYYGVTPARFLANSIEIIDNSIFNLKEKRRGIGFWNDATVGSEGNIISPLVSDNSITGSSGDDVTGSMGIDTIGLVTSAIITGNTITGLDYSFKEKIWNDNVANGTQLNLNSFSNSATGVLTERSSGTLDAENNWWGDGSGPGSVGSGIGDNVSLNVDYTPWLTSEMAVVSPNGGEIVPSGSIYTIQWSPLPSDAVKFDLSYSLDNKTTWKTIANGVTGSSYDWHVSIPLNNKTKCFVKVIWYDASNNKIGEDTSDETFTVEVVKVTSPNGEEVLRSGNIYFIRWETNRTKKPVANTYLSYSFDKGTTWKFLAISVDNLGWYPWPVPKVLNTKEKCKVKVELKDAYGQIVGSDKSDKNFTINPN
jgi:hypothetical protein